tara:strand:+ start:1025 stop:1213 length:189 start_codon:yes stop_codon:yes gene_type:complete
MEFEMVSSGIIEPKENPPNITLLFAAAETDIEEICRVTNIKKTLFINNFILTLILIILREET